MTQICFFISFVDFLVQFSLCILYILLGFHLFAINTLRLRQNSRYYTDNIFKCIFMNEKSLNRWQAIICTNAGWIHWHTYVALGGGELIIPSRKINFVNKNVSAHLHIKLYTTLQT